MIKRAIVGTAALGLMGAAMGVFCFGWDSASYVSTGVESVRTSVRDTVPVGFEIQRARKMIADLVPDIRQNMHVIAEEEVQVKKLEERIARTDAEMTKQREAMLSIKNDLSSIREKFVYAGRSYTQGQVKAELASRFERYKTQDATLASLKQTLTARQTGLSGARQKLDGMVAAKRQLEVDVENLEAQLKLVEAAQTTATYQFDDSRLGRAKELVEGLRTRLDVTQAILNQENQFVGQIELDTEAPADIADQVTAYFDGPQSAEKPLIARTEAQGKDVE